MIEVKNISFKYAGQKNLVFDDFSLELKQDNIYGLLGKNGTGKSTLLYLIAGLLRPKKGTVSFDGVETKLRRPEVLQDIFIVPEEFDLPSMTLNEYVKMLLIKRARIVAGAAEKITRLKEKIEDYKDDNHMLVYCGATTMHDVDYQEGKPPIDEARQIDIVANMLGNDLHMRVSKFTSEEDAEERERIKDDFAAGTQLQALVAIRCLDEGVNIPSIKTAFILASSTNPKEYVQRRGRVLRKFPGKEYATIYDFVTLPIPLDDVSQYDPDVIESVRSLAKREIDRIKDFAAIAENPYDSDFLIADMQREYDIDPEAQEGETEEDYV